MSKDGRHYLCNRGGCPYDNLLGTVLGLEKRISYSIGDPTKVDRLSMIWGKPGSTVELCKGDEILLTIKTIKLSDAGTCTPGLQGTGTDTVGVFSIKVLPKPEVSDGSGGTRHTPLSPLDRTCHHYAKNPIQVINVRLFSY